MMLLVILYCNHYYLYIRMRKRKGASSRRRARSMVVSVVHFDVIGWEETLVSSHCASPPSLVDLSVISKTSPFLNVISFTSAPS